MLPLILAGLGGVKGIADMVKEGKDRDVQAATTKWSPWTGMKAEAPKRADLIGNVMQGGMAGLLMNQMGSTGGIGSTGTPSINVWDSLQAQPGAMQAKNFGRW